MPRKRKGRGAGGGRPAPPGAVRVNGYSEGWLGKGFPWVYDNEIVARGSGVSPGTTVRILGRHDQVLGVGIAAEAGNIAVRRFRHDTGEIDVPWLSEMVRRARARRVIPPETTAWRLVHGENDGLPGIRVDVWDAWISLGLADASLEVLVDPLLDAIAQHHELQGACVHHRTPDGKAVQGWARGAPASEELVVTERGMRLAVKPGQGADAGLYCDMRDVRQFMEPLWAGKRVLNTFAHTGAFSVAAALGGARVTQVDLSGHYTDWAKRNFELNALDVDAHTFIVGDTAKALDRFRRTGERFDVIILDPPAFSTSQDGTWSTERDYPRMVLAGLRVLEPGGLLLAASNQGSVSPKQFNQFLADAARRASTDLRIVHQGSPPMDFPAALSFPEARYLKVWLLERGW